MSSFCVQCIAVKDEVLSRKTRIVVYVFVFCGQNSFDTRCIFYQIAFRSRRCPLHANNRVNSQVPQHAENWLHKHILYGLPISTVRTYSAFTLSPVSVACDARLLSYSHSLNEYFPNTLYLINRPLHFILPSPPFLNVLKVWMYL